MFTEYKFIKEKCDWPIFDNSIIKWIYDIHVTTLGNPIFYNYNRQRYYKSTDDSKCPKYNNMIYLFSKYYFLIFLLFIIEKFILEKNKDNN